MGCVHGVRLQEILYNPCTVGILYPFIPHWLERCTNHRVIRASFKLVGDEWMEDTNGVRDRESW